MRNKRKPAPPASDTPSEAASPPAATRLPNGRWVNNYCPNPKGRPSKPKPEPHDALYRFLDEVLPKGGPGGGLTMREAVLKALCGHAVKNPRIAIELLKRGLLEHPGAHAGDAALEADEEAQLDAFLARQSRRKRPADDDGEDAS